MKAIAILQKRKQKPLRQVSNYIKQRNEFIQKELTHNIPKDVVIGIIIPYLIL